MQISAKNKTHGIEVGFLLDAHSRNFEAKVRHDNSVSECEPATFIMSVNCAEEEKPDTELGFHKTLITWLLLSLN